MSITEVYISSTYRDLKSYREKVTDTLNSIRRFKVVGMEGYTAKGVKPLIECLKDVATCKIYVLILGNRYGYVFPGETKSITQLEYEHAVNLGKEIMAFQCADGDDRFIRDTIRAGQPAVEEKQEALAAFKNLVSGAHTMFPEGFTNEDSLVAQLVLSLINNPSVDFHGEIDPDMKICCDRVVQVTDFRGAISQRGFNLFLIQGSPDDAAGSLVDRLCKFEFHFGTPKLLPVNALISSGTTLDRFKKRSVIHLSSEQWPTMAEAPATDILEFLFRLRERGVTTFSIFSEVTDSLQWEKAHIFINDLFKEFQKAVELVPEVRVFWFLVVDPTIKPGLYADLKSIYDTDLLSPVSHEDFRSWLKKFVGGYDDNVSRHLGDFKNFKNREVTMVEAQKHLAEFIKKYNKKISVMTKR